MRHPLICFFVLAYAISWLAWVLTALLEPYALLVGWLFSLLTGALLVTWLYHQSRGSLLVIALFHAGGDVAYTPDASSLFVINTAGTRITQWGIAVVLVAGPRRWVSRRDHA